jgi:hypothetical protein
VGFDYIESIVGIDQKDAYATGLMMPGTINELMVSIYQCLEVRGMLLTDTFTTLNSGTHIVDYFVKGSMFRLLVVASELVASGEWDYLKSSMPDNQGLGIFCHVRVDKMP